MVAILGLLGVLYTTRRADKRADKDREHAKAERLALFEREAARDRTAREVEDLRHWSNVRRETYARYSIEVDRLRRWLSEIARLGQADERSRRLNSSYQDYVVSPYEVLEECVLLGSKRLGHAAYDVWDRVIGRAPSVREDADSPDDEMPVGSLVQAALDGDVAAFDRAANDLRERSKRFRDMAREDLGLHAFPSS